MMKRLLLLCLFPFLIGACQKETEPGAEQEKEEVSFVLDYSFMESGSMSRSGADIYGDFYNNYIKTKILTPRKFSLTFTNNETGAKATFNGQWDQKNTIKLLEGEYTIQGSSTPNTSSSIAQDSLYLSFNEIVKIAPQTTSLNLQASYDCFMIFLDTSNKNSVYRYHYNPNTSGITSNLKEVSNLYYMFLSKLNSFDELRIYYSSTNERSTIDLTKLPFEKGKYYYFNDISQSFDIPPMQNGEE